MRRAAAAPPRRRRRVRDRRASRLRRAAVVLAAVLLFALGIALGEALHDNPQPGASVTRERTFSVPPGSKTFVP